MFDCLYYWLVAPIRGRIEDNPQRAPAFEIALTSPDWEVFTVRLYCDDKGQPEFFRLVISDLDREVIPAKHHPLIQWVGEHMLSSLRMTYSMDAALAIVPAFWTFIAKGQPHAAGIEVTNLPGPNQYNSQDTKNFFVHTIPIRELMRLYVDGIDPRIPIQYQFLSLYKIIENKFQKASKLDQKGLRTFLSPYVRTFADLGFAGEPATVLKNLRDSCAHIHTTERGGKKVLGVTHLNHKQAVLIDSVLPHLRVICAAAINERIEGKVALSTKIPDPPSFQTVS